MRCRRVAKGALWRGGCCDSPPRRGIPAFEFEYLKAEGFADAFSHGEFQTISGGGKNVFANPYIDKLNPNFIRA